MSGLVGDIIEVAFGVGVLKVHSWGEDLVADGEHAGDEFDGSGGGDEMSHHGLDAGDGDVFGVFAEDGLDGDGFVAVVFAGACAVGVDVMDIGRGEFGVEECFGHSDDSPLALGMLVGDAVGIGGGAVADDFGEDIGVSSGCMLEGFEDDHSRALAEDESIAFCVEGSRGVLRGIVLCGEGGEAIEAGDAEGVDHGMGSAGDHDIGATFAEDLHGFSDGLGGGCAGGEAVEGGSSGAGEEGEMGEGHIGFLLEFAGDVHQLEGHSGPLDGVEGGGAVSPGCECCGCVGLEVEGSFAGAQVDSDAVKVEGCVVEGGGVPCL